MITLRKIIVATLVAGALSGCSSGGAVGSWLSVNKDDAPDFPTLMIREDGSCSLGTEGAKGLKFDCSWEKQEGGYLVDFKLMPIVDQPLLVKMTIDGNELTTVPVNGGEIRKYKRI